MADNFLHTHPDFPSLIQIVSRRLSVSPVLVEKDYWIMHTLYGLQRQEFLFQMKGGTSLSKGYKLIDRFSEDIDILIEPPIHLNVPTGRNQNSGAQCQNRLKYYNWLTDQININGIYESIRDTAFDDTKFRSAGIRLLYQPAFGVPTDIKEGILLEVGFDDISPNRPITISSWAYDFAMTKVPIIDNRAKGVLCYHPGYTFVEKLQTISTKFRRQQAIGGFSENFMRHYYDVYCLLQSPEVLKFIQTDAYKKHKQKRFRQDDELVIALNPAFTLKDPHVRSLYVNQYNQSKSLYYRQKPTFDDILEFINNKIELL